MTHSSNYTAALGWPLTCHRIAVPNSSRRTGEVSVRTQDSAIESWRLAIPFNSEVESMCDYHWAKFSGVIVECILWSGAAKTIDVAYRLESSSYRLLSGFPA